MHHRRADWPPETGGSSYSTRRPVDVTVTCPDRNNPHSHTDETRRRLFGSGYSGEGE